MQIAKLTGKQIKEIAKPLEKLSKYFGIEPSPVKVSYFGNRLQFFCQNMTKQLTINVNLDEPVPITYGHFYIQPDFLFTLSKSLKLKDEVILEQSKGQYHFVNGITLTVTQSTESSVDNTHNHYKEDNTDTQCICRCSRWKTVLKQCLLAATAKKPALIWMWYGCIAGMMESKGLPQMAEN